MSLSIAAVLAAGVALSAAPARSPAHRVLRDHCARHAASPSNPWALAHGVTGLGPDFRAGDGRLALDVIFGDFLQQRASILGGRYGFAAFGPDQTPIEPHANLLVKTAVLAGVSPSRTFKTPGGPVTLKRLVEETRRGFRHQPSRAGYWEDVGWTLDLLTHADKKPRSRFRNGANEVVDLGAIMDEALRTVEQLDAELAAGMDAGAPLVPKRKQGIYGHACGGMHLLQPVFAWARFPGVRKAWGQRLDRQVDVLFYRLDSEARQYGELLTRHPEHALALRVQELKFYGHWLETVGRLQSEVRYPLSKAQRAKVRRAEQLLTRTVEGLQELGAFARQDALMKGQRQVALDLIGDSCHATRGWDSVR